MDAPESCDDSLVLRASSTEFLGTSGCTGKLQGNVETAATQSDGAENSRPFNVETRSRALTDPSLEDPATFAEAHSQGTWTRARHLEVVNHEFCDLLRNPAKETLIIKMPVRHGKSEYLARWAAAWYLLVNPRKRIMVCTNTAKLARTHTRWVRDKVHELSPLFGLQGVDPTNSSAAEWSLSGGGMGGCIGAGVGGSIVGYGCDLLIIDDYIKNAKEAYSETVREAQWDWFLSTSSTRLEPGGKIVLLCCLTGDAGVAMADGSTKPIRDIKSGDRVKTFDKGSLSVSTIRNHAMGRHDDVYRIELGSGQSITGNARHPFLVEIDGRLEWRRLKNLSTAMKIVTVKDSGESGRGKHANGTDARKLLSAEGIARVTTQESERWTGTSPQASETRTPIGGTILGIATESVLNTMKLCTRRKEDYARSADNHVLKRIAEGGPTFASIIATNRARSEDSCVSTAILQPDILGPVPPPLSSLNISEFMSERIVSIEYAGREEVFDIEVEDTHAFIANGMVTHNTQWHCDDLIGRIMKHRDESRNVRCVTMQAIRESNGTKDPLSRAEGEALWPERWPAEVLERRRRRSAKWWNAIYQGRPGVDGDNEWPASYFANVYLSDDAEFPECVAMSAMYADPSKGKNSRRGDYFAIVYVAYRDGKLYIDSLIDRRPVEVMVRRMAQFAKDYRPRYVGIEGNAFQDLLGPLYSTACEEIGYFSDAPTLDFNTTPKRMRIDRLGPLLRNADLVFRRTLSNEILVQQLKDHPNAKHDDGPDALESAIRLLDASVSDTAGYVGDYTSDDPFRIIA